MSNAAAAYEVLEGQVGADQGHGDWFEMTQQRFNDFADATLDHQFIHLDAERAKADKPALVAEWIGRTVFDS